MKLRRNLIHDRVSHLDSVSPVTLQPGTSVREAIEAMRRERRGCVLICEEGHLVGIFTERDVLKRVLAAGVNLDAPVSTVMTAAPVTTMAAESVGGVIRKMLGGGHRHLPVLDERGVPVGVLSVKGLIHYLVEHFPTTVYNLPPRPGQVHHSREGA